MNSNIKDMLKPYENIQVSEAEKIRELLQQSALLGLYRANFFAHAAFYGGTALRILYGMNRFSEDLDFSLLKPNLEFNFSPFLSSLEKEMESLGFQVTVTKKEKNQFTGILSAFLKTNTLNLLLNIAPKDYRGKIHPEQQIKIKLELDTDPSPGFRTLSVVSREPTPFQVLTYHQSDLFAGKLHACLYRAWKKRVKGRDWFDFVWFIQKNIPLNFDHFKRVAKHIGGKEYSDPKELFSELQQKIKTIDWTLAKKDVERFIPDPRVVAPWSSELFLGLIEYIKLEKSEKD